MVNHILKSLVPTAVVGLCLLGTGARAQTFTTIDSFNFGAGGTEAGVTLDSSGNLYGTQLNGGTYSKGIVWEIPAGTSTIQIVASFSGSNGAYPYGGVTFDSSGNMYGTAGNGGAYNYGVVWKIAAGTSTITKVADFNGTNGKWPYDSVSFDTSGNMYGTASQGGAYGDGTVWKISSGTSSISVLGSFSGANGNLPESGVTVDSSGNLYGVTNYGGAGNYGVVWRMAAGSATISAIDSFTGSLGNGSYPICDIVFDSAGTMYGTATGGGASNYGTVWKVASGTSSISVIASCASTTAQAPRGRLVIDGSGNLYGAAQNGPGSDYGAVWEIASGTSTITDLFDFAGSADGQTPLAGLTADGYGNLYGTTDGGGTYGKGTVFELTP